VSHFRLSSLPKDLWLLDRVKEVKGVAIGVTRSMARERVASSGHIDNILELEATAQAYTNQLPPFALSLAFQCLRRPQTAPIVPCSRPSGGLWKPLIEGVGGGDIWPIGRILPCREHHRLGQLEKELAIPPNLRGMGVAGC